MSNMPFEDSVFFLPIYQAAKSGEDYNPEDKDRRWYKKQLDKMRGREGRERKQISLDNFMQEVQDLSLIHI